MTFVLEKSFETAKDLYQQSKRDFLDIQSRYKRGLASREDLIRFQLSYENFKQQQQTRKQRLWRSEKLLSILVGRNLVAKQVDFSLSPKYFNVAKDVLQRNLADASSVDVSIKTDEYQLAAAYKDSYTNHIPTLSLFSNKLSR